jgi:uncharacterized protein
MIKEPWINLPVKNVTKSVAFFKQLGFSFNAERTNEMMAAMIIGKAKIAFMLFDEKMFQSFIQHPIADTSKGSEVLISFDAESAEEVDTLVANVKAAGGTVYGEPGWNQGWMYGCGFVDLDGHRWNMLYMDLSKMPK